MTNIEVVLWLSYHYNGVLCNQKDSIYIDTAATSIQLTMPVGHLDSPANYIITCGI